MPATSSKTAAMRPRTRSAARSAASATAAISPRSSRVRASLELTSPRTAIGAAMSRAARPTIAARPANRELRSRIMCPSTPRENTSRASAIPTSERRTKHRRAGPVRRRLFGSDAMRALRGLLRLVQRLLVDLQDGLVLLRDGERDHARDEPLGPHLVDGGLEVLHVLVGEVGEPALALQVLVHRLALLAALGDLPGGAGEVAHAVDDLVQRPDAGLDREVAELLAVLRVVVPALRARVE